LNALVFVHRLEQLSLPDRIDTASGRQLIPRQAHDSDSMEDVKVAPEKNKNFHIPVLHIQELKYEALAML
jgi:hypothetical protein